MFDYTRNLLPPARPTQRGSYGGTIIVLLIALVCYLLIAIWAVASAQTATAEANANSGAWSQSDSVSAAGVEINNYGQTPGRQGTTYSEARVENAPSLGGLALGGGHPCAYSPATAQISIIGGGAGIGGSKVDSACMLMVMGAAGDKRAYTAAQIMLAARDPAACRAMEAAGIVTCSDKKRGTASASAAGTAEPARKDFSKSSKSAASPTRTDFNGVMIGNVRVWKCEKTGKKKVVFSPYGGNDALPKADQKRACLAALGF